MQRTVPVCRILIVIAAALFLTACSTQTSYKYLDWIIPWYVEGLVTLDEDQQDLLNSYLKTSLSWHKETQIPKYIDTLTEIKLELNQLDSRKLEQYYEIYDDYWTRILVRTTPHITKLLKTASEEQLQELFDNLVQQNKDLRKQYVTPTPAVQNRTRSQQFKDQIRYWIGELSPRQIRAINKWSERLLPTNELWIEHRLQWQENFQYALESRMDSEYFDDVMHDLLISPDQFWSRRYVKTQRVNEEYTIRLLLYLANDLSPQQRAYFNTKIDGIIEQLSEIHYSSS